MRTKIFRSFVASSLFLLIASPALAIGKPQFVPNIHTQDATGAARACEARENAVKNRMTHITRLAGDMETKFDGIASRVENFYTTKDVPNGKIVSNYSALVANIAAQKTAVQSALTQAQNDVNTFNCTVSNAKAKLTQFREDMQAVKRALKVYRTAIKDLIVAVHSITGAENSESTKGGNQQ